MKRLRYSYVLLIVFHVLLFNSCSENGLQGPEGPVGQQGLIGPAGVDGSVLHSGNGLPDQAIGKFGDYYLDRLTSDFYGPKVSTGWGTPIRLKGENGTNGVAGTNGTNGSNIYSGKGAPAPSLGVIGDYYLDRLNVLIYGPKGNLGWSVGILLRGAQGIQGPIGPAGADGSIIYGGNGAPAAILGKVNDYYFDRTNILMYGPKTTTWGAGVSLRGTDGINGINGTNGTNGTNGADGNTILNGTTAPAISLGKLGDFYINITTYEIYGPKTATSWGTPTSLKAMSSSSSTVIALETDTADVVFNWGYEQSDRYCLRQHKVSFFNDSTSTFNIPPQHVAAARTGSVMVYMGVDSSVPNVMNWYQLNFSEISAGAHVMYKSVLRTSATTASVRILSYFLSTVALHQVKKIRIVILPPTQTGLLGRVNRNFSLPADFSELNLSDKDFIKF